MVLEKSIERYLKKRVENIGGLCIKQSEERGIPDRLILLKDGRHCFVEMKRPDGALSEIQKEYIKRLQNRGHTVYVLYSYSDVDDFIKKIS